MLPFLEKAFSAIKKQYYDDFADRINYYYTALLLLFMALVVSAKQYVGQPIQCWVPAQFRGGWEQYAETYCFVQNTYFLPFEKGIPRRQIDRENGKIGYYQWVPIVLAVQAVLFYMPNMIWKWFNGHSGINVKSILGMATESNGFDPVKRRQNVDILARHIEDSLGIQEDMGHPGLGGFLCSRVGFDTRRVGSYLCCLYLFVKFLYIINVCGQFFLMNDFLGTNYTFWGVQMLMDLANGRQWSESGHFPRVTLCDFDIRDLGQVQTHTVQCVLIINMFNEKIYLFIWFWMFFIGLCTGVNLLWWLFSCFPSASRRWVHRYLRVARPDLFGECQTPADARRFEKFVRKGLRPDGILLLRFISGHAGDLVVTELVAMLYEHYDGNGRPRHYRTNIFGKPVEPPAQHNGDVPKGNGKIGHRSKDDDGFKESGDAEDSTLLMTNGYASVLPSAPLKDHSICKGIPSPARGGYPGPPAAH